jgi:hypothetical protein
MIAAASSARGPNAIKAGGSMKKTSAAMPANQATSASASPAARRPASRPKLVGRFHDSNQMRTLENAAVVCAFAISHMISFMDSVV